MVHMEHRGRDMPNQYTISIRSVCDGDGSEVPRPSTVGRRIQGRSGRNKTLGALGGQLHYGIGSLPNTCIHGWSRW